MIVREIGSIVILGLVVVGLIAASVSKKPDGVVEEVAESLLESKLGVEEGSIDFSPGSKEEKK